MRLKSTPYLPGFPCRFDRPRTPRLARLKRQFRERSERPLAALQSLFSSWVDASQLAPRQSKANSRQRTFSLEVVFWGFLFQILGGVGCSGAVSKVQAWLVRCGQSAPSSNTSAYCQGRNRLPLRVLESILESVSSRVTGCVRDTDLWFGHRVKVVDGTGLSAPDTAANQAEWPQTGKMKPGCGFPQIRLVGLFCLHSGALLGWKEGSKHHNETRLWCKLWKLLSPGDVVLGDRAFGSYFDMAMLKAQGVHGVYRLNSCRKIDWQRGRRLGRRDQLQVWNKPKCRSKRCTAEQWNDVPSQLEVRLIEKMVEQPGFRPTKIVVVTTLTDPCRYPADQIIQLYRKRWDVELFLRDIKTTLGMDVLKCRTPAMIRKEVVMHLICYNLLRGMMQQAARQERVSVERLSFKGTAQKLHEWMPLFMEPAQPNVERRRRLVEFYRSTTTAPVPDRPDRTEPRVLKRRPKYNYNLMTKPRNTRKPARNV